MTVGSISTSTPCARCISKGERQFDFGRWPVESVLQEFIKPTTADTLLQCSNSVREEAPFSTCKTTRAGEGSLPARLLAGPPHSRFGSLLATCWHSWCQQVKCTGMPKTLARKAWKRPVGDPKLLLMPGLLVPIAMLLRKLLHVAGQCYLTCNLREDKGREGTQKGREES